MLVVGGGRFLTDWTSRRFRWEVWFPRIIGGGSLDIISSLLRTRCEVARLNAMFEKCDGWVLFRRSEGDEDPMVECGRRHTVHMWADYRGQQ